MDLVRQLHGENIGKTIKIILGILGVIVIGIISISYAKYHDVVLWSYKQERVSGLFIYTFSFMIFIWMLIGNFLRTGNKIFDVIVEGLGSCGLAYCSFVFCELPENIIRENHVMCSLYEGAIRSQSLYQSTPIYEFRKYLPIIIVVICIIVIYMRRLGYIDFSFLEEIFENNYLGFMLVYVAIEIVTYIMYKWVVYWDSERIFDVGAIVLTILFLIVYSLYNMWYDADENDGNWSQKIVALLEIELREWIMLGICIVLLIISIFTGNLQNLLDIVSTTFLDELKNVEYGKNRGEFVVCFVIVVSMYAEIGVTLLCRNNSIIGKVNEYLAMLLANIWLVPLMEEFCWRIMLGDWKYYMILMEFLEDIIPNSVYFIQFIPALVIGCVYLVFTLLFWGMYYVGCLYVFLVIYIFEFVSNLFYNTNSVIGTIILMIVMKIVTDQLIPKRLNN